MLVVEFRDDTRAVLDDEIARQIVGTDADGDVLIETRRYQPAVPARVGVIENGQVRGDSARRPAVPGELRALTPCCHHVGEQSLDYKSGAVCSYCKDPVDEKYVMAASVYTGVAYVASIEEVMRNRLPKGVDKQAIAQASQLLADYCTF